MMKFILILVLVKFSFTNRLSSIGASITVDEHYTKVIDSTECKWKQDTIKYYVERPKNDLNTKVYDRVIKKCFRKWTKLVKIKAIQVDDYDSADVAFIWIDDVHHENHYKKSSNGRLSSRFRMQNTFR